MDQSTQVNFPYITRYPKNKIGRCNTLADLQQTPKILRYSSSLSQLKPIIRPRSLNLTTEMIQKNKFNYTENSIPRLAHPQSEVTLTVLARERSQQFCSNSSFILNGSPQRTSPPNKLICHGKQTALQIPLNYQGAESSSSSTRSCQCFYEMPPTHSNEKIPTNTPEGLSWRRLHMSRAKLKATSTTSELLSGFAMVAMVELQINEDTAVPEWLFVMFSVCTTVLVAVHIFALMISTYILPNIDAISKLDVCELVSESPHERMKGFIEVAWAFSTVLGLFLFLVEVAILCWVKFWDYSFTAAIAATVIVIPVLIIFVLFAVHFYHSLVVYRCDTSMNDMKKLEDMKKQLDEVTTPV